MRLSRFAAPLVLFDLEWALSFQDPTSTRDALPARRRRSARPARIQFGALGADSDRSQEASQGV